MFPCHSTLTFVMPQDAFKNCGKIWSGNLAPATPEWTLDRRYQCPGPFVVEVTFTGPSGQFSMESLGTWIRIAELSVKQ